MTRASRRELRARGRRERGAVARRSHAVLPADAQRADPLVLLEAQDRVRVPELLPLRYGRMAGSPFGFLRGAAAVMSSDLSLVPTTTLTTQLSGDAHLQNFGVFATPERRLVFDLDDFDQTLPGPFEWDLKRLGASLVIAARDRGFDSEQAAEAAFQAMDSYRETMRRHAAASVLEVWYASVDEADVRAALALQLDAGEADPALLDTAERALERARRRTSDRAADRLTEVVDGRIRMREDPPVLSRDVLPPGRRALAQRYLAAYRDSLPSHRHTLLARYEVVDVARRVVGVGSVGTRCYVVLLHGRDEEDPLVLQVKEATASVLEPYLPATGLRPAGRRVVEGQRTLQTVSDIFLGWLRARGPDGQERDFYVRQFRDMKGGVDLARLRPGDLALHGRLCGHLLANAHARGGEPAVLAGYLGSSQGVLEALVAFARGYADITEADHQTLCRAIRAGRLPAESA